MTFSSVIIHMILNTVITYYTNFDWINQVVFVLYEFIGYCKMNQAWFHFFIVNISSVYSIPSITNDIEK